MSRLSDAISWSGKDVTLPLFVIWPAVPGRSGFGSGSGTPPDQVKIYRLDPPDQRLGSRTCYEYDLVFQRSPLDLETIVSSWLAQAVRAGSHVAWFAFEGSFDFEELLTADIADQIFGVADADGVRIALEDGLRGDRAWAEVILHCRQRLLAELG